MMENTAAGDSRLKVLVLTSTYPRRIPDTVPVFVHELARRLGAHFDLTVLAPHGPGLPLVEEMEGVTVRRFRYLPPAWESLTGDGGIPARLRQNPWRWIQVPFFFLFQFLAAWRELRRTRADVIHAHWLLPQ